MSSITEPRFELPTIRPRPRRLERPSIHAARPAQRYAVVDPIIDGVDVGLLACGGHLREVLAAARRLDMRGISAAVVHVDVRTPFDSELVLELAERLPLLVTFEDRLTARGLGALVADVLARAAEPTRLATITLEELWLQRRTRENGLDRGGVDPESLARRIEVLLEGGR